MSRRITLLVIVGSFLTTAGFSQEPQPTAEEIVARHLKSLGTDKELERNRLRVAVGTSKFDIQGVSKRTVQGGSAFASDGLNMAFISTFDMADYRMERIGLFEDRINIPFVDAGKRSPLGSFLTSYDKVLSSRILGGAIFSSWVFGRSGDHTGRIRNAGKKKINGRDVWVVEYSPKGGLPPGASIKLFFDAENYHHLRTVYEQKDADPGFYNTDPGLVRGATPLSSYMREWTLEMASNSHSLTEDFEEINPVGGVTLPFKYKITLSIDSYKGTAHFDWTFVIREYKLVKEFPQGTFNFKTQSAG